MSIEVLLRFVMVLCVCLVIMCMAYLIKTVIPWILSMSYNDRLRSLNLWAEKIVRDLERYPMEGYEKKGKALEFLVATAVELQIDVTTGQLDQIIEAAVYDMNNEKRSAG